MAEIWNIWKAGHQSFEEVGIDNFVLATPHGNVLWTSDPSVVRVRRFLIQHDKSLVPVEIRFYDIWRPTVGSVEGEGSKNHRRVMASAFSPATNTAVWKEAIEQTQALVNHWIEDESIIPVVREWTSRLALHVISGVFFHKPLKWEGNTLNAIPSAREHRVSYEEALFTVVARLVKIIMTPRAILGMVPLQFFSEHTLRSQNGQSTRKCFARVLFPRSKRSQLKRTKAFLVRSFHFDAQILPIH